ncbi:hypothetical protein [Phormidium sp. CCY1219]|uniref:hypothetical protein n=1 Tax=Phormidium sp. CCY1219 TaxID=2886104 RepID=UPI002D1E61B7|nr:hypothetical protein [Phormidium sp. CCY1219]MEB3827612.1 hypothetical protein [Phormidium sp. CCY1219]
MARATSNKPTFTIHQLIERILENREISRKEHIQLATAMLSGKQITDEDRRHMNRIFDSIQAGRVKIV